LQAIVDNGKEPTVVPALERIVNHWYSHAKRGVVYLYRTDVGRLAWIVDHDQPRRNLLWFNSFAAMDAWNVQAEHKAMERLKGLISERMWRAYYLTGGFLETSKKSDLTYWFRRLRPTVVLTTHGNGLVSGAGSRILVALCLHSVAYYADTFCGGLCPTDDVVAHLLMMRADEHRFWKHANHHEPHSVLAGL
jgi:hypothetical protein